MFIWTELPSKTCVDNFPVFEEFFRILTAGKLKREQNNNENHHNDINDENENDNGNNNKLKARPDGKASLS